MDLAWTVEWLLDLDPPPSSVAAHTPQLLDTLALLHAQGYDREVYFEKEGPLGDVGDTQNSHNVNVAQVRPPPVSVSHDSKPVFKRDAPTPGVCACLSEGPGCST
jgi:hypothetical protein